MRRYYIEDVSELTKPELAQMAKEWRDRAKGRIPDELMAQVSDEKLIQGLLDGRAWQRDLIAKAEANDTRPIPETEEQLRARVIAERVLKEVAQAATKMNGW
jgi:hypothetical protein